MRVGELLAPDGWFPTDHRPVTLVLGLAVGGTGTSAKGCCQKKRAVFEISRYRDYAALFTDGSQVMHALNGVITDLSNGACNSTESVERISTLLRKVLIRVFAGRRPEGMQAGGGALWWNEECQSVRQHMLACRVRLGPGRVENKSGPLWEAFCKARNAMNRAKRRARAAYDAERMHTMPMEPPDTKDGIKSVGAVPGAGKPVICLRMLVMMMLSICPKREMGGRDVTHGEGSRLPPPPAVNDRTCSDFVHDVVYMNRDGDVSGHAKKLIPRIWKARPFPVSAQSSPMSTRSIAKAGTFDAATQEPWQ
ncbi:hypothetical protein VOLCADRAFT_87978 [Volvox carteri f. nagariensis]|uniref:Uncharacterized protein n=1 Tax=Volvox carteri f. nagariensis TaxID=3068 RepID=D8TMR6_VOLCA|nr:uncharacterized protein VOLCADRAFT_87978 [Volvox carteri f. nagariensis]EFJ51173.1 hypothetical protein VOLCADRAFT_87978 [Volvox carteri f. nagariensis]|eukprot:XP_002947640.1 hypothetical protein VOLCADRAFT_87978 [Volvox carteri f. nagariensis]